MGIRELKQNPSTIIAQVKTGEAFTVTERGVPVAKIVPISEDPFTALVQEGVIGLPQRQFNISHLRPLKLPPGVSVDGLMAELGEESLR